MTTPAEVREHLRVAEGFLRGTDPYGATARARLAARKAASIDSADGAALRQEVALEVDRCLAAREAMRAEAARRAGHHVERERRAERAREDEVEERSPARRSWLAALLRRRPRRQRRPAYSFGT